MILFTDKKHFNLDLVKVEIIGAVKTIDAGEQDDKIICVEADCGLKNLRKHMKKAMKFLKSYKGKNADMVIEKKLVSEYDAEELLKDAHKAYKEKAKNNSVISVATNVRKSNKVRVVRG